MPRATVWPLLPNVQDGPMGAGRFMPGPRDVELDDPFWRARLADGSVCLHDPAPPAPPEPDPADKE